MLALGVIAPIASVFDEVGRGSLGERLVRLVTDNRRQRLIDYRPADELRRLLDGGSTQV